MKIDQKLIHHLARLSKLEFNAEDEPVIQENLGKILDLVEKLQELDTSGVEPLVYINENLAVFRKDEAIQNTTKEDALKNAPSKDSDYFKVPKVIAK